MTIGLAAGFEPDLARSYGDLIGAETATLGQHVLEGPGVCLHRTTIAGRNFEYFSEDPYLSDVASSGSWPTSRWSAPSASAAATVSCCPTGPVLVR